VANFLFWLHKKMHGYPCRAQVRKALHIGKCKNPLKYRVAMLYLCGYTVEETARVMELPLERVITTLNIICLGVN
jgi:hypothetical protein